METGILLTVFVAAFAVAAFAVLAFSGPIDAALSRLIPPEMKDGWSRAAKFALFTATLIGGLRLQDLQALASRGQTAGVRPEAGQGLIEVYRTIAGSLEAAAWALGAFFIGALCVHAAIRVYEAVKPSVQTRSPERSPGDRHGPPLTGGRA